MNPRKKDHLIFKAQKLNSVTSKTRLSTKPAKEICQFSKRNNNAKSTKKQAEIKKVKPTPGTRKTVKNEKGRTPMKTRSTSSRKELHKNTTDSKSHDLVLQRKVLNTITVEKYSNINLQKGIKNFVVKLQRLDLNIIKQYSNSDGKITSKLSESKTMKKTHEMKISQPNVESKEMKTVEKTVSAVDLDPPAVLPNPCENGCRHFCKNITEEERYQLNKTFWSLDSQQAKDSFFDHIIRYKWIEEDCVVCYYFMTVSGLNQRVCPKFFLATLNIKIDVIVQHVSKVIKANKSDTRF